MFTIVTTKSQLNGRVMIHADGTEEQYVECFWKSTDTRRTDVPNATPGLEFDTKKVFIFDAETKEWIEQ